jgi:hypothetical protein
MSAATGATTVIDSEEKIPTSNTTSHVCYPGMSTFRKVIETLNSFQIRNKLFPT